MPFPVFPPQEKSRRTTNAPDPCLFVDHLGEPLPIFLHKDVPTRDSLIQLITQNGGELANAMRHAVYLIVDPHSSDGQDTIDGYGDRPDKRVLRPEWLGMCVAAGRLVIANDWAGCRLGRTPQPRKRPADEQDPAAIVNKQPRTDIPSQTQAPPQAPPQPSFAYPTYPIVPGYYPPQYPYYDPNPQPAQAPQAAPPIKKRNPRPPRQPNRPWTLEENVALYNFMSQNSAPTEREQATLVRRWAKETRPDRGRQSWVAHAFATSFKNWVKEYEAGNVNANPADFGAGPDPDGEAEADPDHQPASPEFSQSTGEFSQAAPGAEQSPNQQYTFGPSTSGTFPNGPAQYTSPSNHSYTSTPNQAYASPTHGQFATEGQGSNSQAFTGFTESQQQQQLATSQQQLGPGQQLSVNPQQQLPSNQPQPQQPTQQITSPRPDDQQTTAVTSPSNAAGFPPLYPMVYPPTAPGDGEEGKKSGGR
ncbi:unnamed protein product [Rhizoctonia solani]|uniref:BRCT domain-containing protein n=1 Tax=Rhizoctonia solani TaxID=456999 RepID=A0A8H3E6Z3_9AGAM|nr:unnamed protein product [Rhizoctonia solani]